MITSIFNTKIGNFRLSEESRRVTELAFTSEPPTNICGIAETVQLQIKEYLEGNRTSFDFPYELKGTEFQISVWKALEQIPYGETRSYKDIARAIGNPAACRAVGGAIHRNPILIAIPCHRVIGADGSLTGFGAGLELKEKLLTLEGWVRK